MKDKFLDCKTVGFFLKISKEIDKAWRKSLMRTKRTFLTSLPDPKFSQQRNIKCFDWGKETKCQKKKVQLFIVLFISFCSNYALLQRLPLTRALKGFFLQVQTCVLVDVNQPLPWFFTCWPRADSFPVSRALGRTCPRLSRFCNILLQDPAQLHVKITRSTNLLSVCRRKLKLSPYTHCKLQQHKLSQCTFATRLSSC